MHCACAHRRPGGHAACQYVPPEGTPADACAAFKNLDMQPNIEGVDHNAHNASVVAIRPPTGEILAMVGSVDYNNEEIDGEVNMALADNQPGSSFKPFTYLEAFLQGYTPATRLMDVRTVFPNPPIRPTCRRTTTASTTARSRPAMPESAVQHPGRGA